jgi:hypothetical protein
MIAALRNRKLRERALASPLHRLDAEGCMKAVLIAGTAALALACGPGAAGSHHSSQDGATDRAGVANTAQPHITVTGCLENAGKPEGEPVGTGGGGSEKNAPDQMNAGAGSHGERYTLTHATSATAETNPSASSYILDGNVRDLRAHVNQQVRIEGELDPAAANTAGPQRIRVASVETVEEACLR